MPARFSKTILRDLNQTKSIYIRSGEEHRYTRTWVVVVDGRVFVRSWNDLPTGWYRAFLNHATGSVQVLERVITVRGRKIRSARLLDAVTRAFPEKYNTKANAPWARGFEEPQRVVNTLELLPAT